MIHIQNLFLNFGTQDIFKGLSLHIKPNDCIGLIGDNGAGKTTLLRTIVGENSSYEGRIQIAKQTSIGYLSQETAHMLGKSVLEETISACAEVLSLAAEIKALETSLTKQSDERTLDRLGQCQSRFEELDGYSLEARARQILQGLGFKASALTQPVETFSGGWQMRISLAKLLLQRPSLLLLDEPTNHLDISSVEWLESYLKGYPGAVVVVSHDRFFLDRVVRRIIVLEHGKGLEYTGNFSAYESQRALREEQLLQEYERQKDEIAKIEAFIERFRYKASKAAQVQSRVKMLEKIERIIPPNRTKKIGFRFPEAERAGNVILSLEQVKKQYDNHLVLKGLTFKVERGEHIAIVGENGAGKSTLCRLLCQKEVPTSGEMILGHNVRIGYYAQEVADVLQSNQTVLQEIQEDSGSGETGKLRTLLGAFLFEGDDVFKPVKVLSGGEKSRLTLAKLMLKRSNLLILDEPTNHLDIAGKDMLCEALKSFNGTVIVISHDRYFLDKIVTRVLSLDAGCLTEYFGNYGYYLEQKERELQSAIPSGNKSPLSGTASSDANSSADRKEQKRMEAQVRQEKAKKRKVHEQSLAKVETEIHDLEARKESLEALLSDPETFKQEEKAVQAQKEYQDVTKKLSTLYEDWERFSELVESLS